MREIDPKVLADEHWDYIRGVIENMWRTLYDSEPEKYIIDFAGHHYKTAFIHGFKHGVESIKEVSCEK